MSVFALQYARALADVVMSGSLDTHEIDRQLAEFTATLSGSKELREVFGNPAISLDSKLKVLDAIAPRIGMMKQVRNFFAVLLQNDRIDAVNSIVTEYRSEMNLRLHISEAEITSVRELSEEDKAKLETQAANLAGVKVRLHYKQDPSLLGGIVLRLGDTVYDGSVRGRLSELRDKLLQD